MTPTGFKRRYPQRDITCEVCLPNNPIKQAQVIAKQDGRVYGTHILNELLALLPGPSQCHTQISNGSDVSVGDVVLNFEAPIHSILAAERILLNLLQRLCGIATLTQRFVQALNQPKIQILDTRKTTPGLRFLEKDAVLAGGGHNHRQNLSDMILIKENHLIEMANNAQLEQLDTICQNAKAKHNNIPIEIEIETLAQLQQWSFQNIDYILFDNFDIPTLKQAITYCQTHQIKAQREVSGNISLSTIHHYQDLDIHRISVGSLTHSAKALDLSLLIL
ncbi:MAG: nicotinate-nucleotide diphosphorylase (carboxylating) [Actinobacteria bacterium]|nr:nicotinate-nucleotide diphosphorylase (carboxylating) [Actinomycetota bacterium]